MIPSHKTSLVPPSKHKRAPWFTLLLLVACLASASRSARAQLQPVDGITTAAGNGVIGNSGDGGAATSAMVANPRGLITDAAGNLYIADSQSNRIRKVDTNGIITTYAGTGAAGFAGDGGPASSAVLNGPYSLALDAAGNLYFTDQGNARVRSIDAVTGTIKTIAGTGLPANAGSTTGDGGPATSANISPYGITCDLAGNVYISTTFNIRKVTAATGIISTVAGNSTGVYSGDGGQATSAGFQVVFLAVDTHGNLYLYDQARIRKVVLATGIITTVVGTGVGGLTGDGGPATSATIIPNENLAVDLSGNVYLTSYQTVRMINVGTGIIQSIAGTLGKVGFAGDGGAAPQATLDTGSDITVDRAQNIYFTDFGNGLSQPRVRKVFPMSFPATNIGSTSSGTLYLQTTTAETLSSFTIPVSQGNKQEYTVGVVTGCTADGATSNPAGTICTVPLTFTPAYPGQRTQPVQASTSAGNVNVGLSALGIGPLAALTPGIIQTVAGGGSTPGSGFGSLATNAMISVNQSTILVDSAGNLYFQDFSCSFAKVSGSTGIMTLVAGNGLCQTNGDGGQATAASIYSSGGFTRDSAGNLYIADENTVRKVNAATGIITTVAGNGSQGNTGDGGLAVMAQLYLPGGLAVDAAGNLFVASLRVVRRVDAITGIITTYAGNGTFGYLGDGGPATNAEFKMPIGLALDPAGNLLILDASAAVLRKVNAATGIITTIAGSIPSMADTGDGGPATNARFVYPVAVTTDSAGNIYIADPTGTLVRKIEATSGIISTVAGVVTNNGAPAYPNGVPATSVGLNTPYSVAVDGAGNLYLADSATIRKVAAAQAGLVYPTTTNVGAADTADNPLTASILNMGNAALTFAPPATGNNPVVSAGWSLDQTATCSQVSAGSASSALAPGQSCSFAVDFTPTKAGANNGTLVVTDNSLNDLTSAQSVSLTGSGAAVAGPALVLAPTSVTFANTQVGGASGSQAVTVTNNGSAAATSLVVSLIGANPGSFTQTNNCGASLAAKATCTINVVFAPQSSGTQLTATVSVASNDPASPATATLKGTGNPAGSLTILPIAQAFPATTVGSNSSTLTSTIYNTTAQAIYLSAGSLTDSADFTQVDNCNGLVAAVTGTCNVSFSFTPKSNGPLASTYMIHDLNNPATPLTVALSGNGTAPLAAQAALTPASASFGTVTVGNNSTQVLTLTNAGNAALAIASTSLAAGPFTLVTKTCTTTLAAASSCTFTLTYTPTAIGTQTATFSVTDAVGTQSSALTGTAVAAPAPQAALTPATAAYGSVPINTTATAQGFTLTNAGTAALPITSVTLTGAGFALTTNTCGTSLTAGATCTVFITFTPSSAAAYAGTLTVTDSVGTQTSTLSGTGTNTPPPDFTITPTPAAQSSYRGQSVNYSIALASLSGANPFTGPVTLNATGLPAGAVATFSPATVIPGSGTVLTVSVPALTSSNRTTGLAFASLFATLLLIRRKRLSPRLLAMLLAFACTALSGCGTGTGFFIPTSTSTITVTGTSGAIVHSTTVTLTVK